MSPSRALYFYGFGYNAIGIGCAGPILAGLSIFAVTYGGFVSALVAFLIYAVVMVALLFLVSWLAGSAKTALVEKLRESTRPIQKISGLTQLGVGLFLIYSSVYTDVFVRLLFPRT